MSDPKRNDPGKVYLSDVASAAGVSLATVSRVISGSPHPIAQETREKVLHAAKQLNYTSDPLARAFARRMTNTVGVIVRDITDHYFAEIVRGAEDTAGRQGFLTVVCNTDCRAHSEIDYLRLLLEHKAAGIIIAGGWYAEAPEARELADVVAAAAASRSRVVILSERTIEAPTFMVDEGAVAADLTRHLVGLGHRRIAFVEGPAGLSTSMLRVEGFRRGMAEAGLSADLVIPGGFTIEAGRAAATRLVAGTLPDAVIGATDDSAIGILMTLRQAGIDVPRQISVAGIDDSQLAQLFELTSVHIPTYGLGSMAARAILAPADTPVPRRTVLPHRIVARGSTSWAPRMIEGAGPKRAS